MPPSANPLPFTACSDAFTSAFAFPYPSYPTSPRPASRKPPFPVLPRLLACLGSRVMAPKRRCAGLVSDALPKSPLLSALFGMGNIEAHIAILFHLPSARLLR